MTTAINGYTKAGADSAFSPTGHTHPGGGGVLLGTSIGFANAASLVGQLGTYGSTEFIPDGWTFSDDQGLGAGAIAGDHGWGYANAGLYQIDIALAFGLFNATPDLINVELSTYWGDGWAWNVPCYAPNPIHARSLYGNETLLTTSVHYAPDSIESGTDENANRLVIRWMDSAGVWKNMNGLGPSGSSVSLYLRRYAPLS